LQDMGGYPTTLKALNSPEMKNFNFAEVFRNELKHAKPWPAHPNIIAIVRNVIAPYGQKGIVGELTPQQALDQAAAEAQAIMDGKK
jgi:ABC-type glycerol-3-phosphate transport system substrate-binding protein